MEDYEFDRTVKILKSRLKMIKEDIQMSEDEKKQHIASINRQWKALRKEFIKDLPEKEKYDRAKKKQADKKEIEEYEER